MIKPAKALRALGGRALDALLPPRCLSCGATVGAGGDLCATCWPRIAQLGPPQCDCCGQPFPYDLGPGQHCATCLASPPPYRRARAALLYDEASRGLVLAFKHADRAEALPAFARWMARAGADLLRDCDALVPVPLHWRRLFKRRYNQAALLAQALGRLADKPVLATALRRRRATPSQGHLSRRQRAANVAGAFVVPPGARARLAGRRLLLIDDVLTTGATAAAATRALLAADATRVEVLTLAQVVRQSP